MLSVTIDIPQSDLIVFAQLPDKARATVQKNLEHMRYIAQSPRSMDACKTLSKLHGGSHHRYYHKWRDFCKKGSWRSLVDKRFASCLWSCSEKIGIPKAFMAHWQALCLTNQRKNKPAYRKLLSQLQDWRDQRGDPIPGYQTPPPNARGYDHPRGWSYENLMRFSPSEIECAAIRTGRSAAQALTSGVHTTRVGMYPFQEIQFDDMWHDFEVNVYGHGQRATRRLLEFGAIDVYSTYIFDPGIKPRIKDIDTGKMKHLNEKDFRFYVANFLCNIGYHPNGTVLNMEHGTATLRHTIVQSINLLTGGKVTIKKSGISGTGAFLGAYSERAKGNFKAKALKEGIGNLIHNETAFLPGQIGKNRDSMPASTHGRQQENQLLLAIAAQYPDIAQDLQYGFLTYDQAIHAIGGIYQKINNRTDHKNEGWEKEGLIFKEYRYDVNSTEWLPYQNIEQLPHSSHAIVAPMLAANPDLRRIRKMSPSEVIDRAKTNLIKLPYSVLPDLIGRDLGKLRSIHKGLFQFHAADCGPGTHRYRGVIKDRDGFDSYLKENCEYLTFINPFSPDRLIVCDTNGAFLGEAAKYEEATRADEDAIYRLHGKAQKEYKDRLRALNLSQGKIATQRLERNNQALKKAIPPSTNSDTAQQFGEFFNNDDESNQSPPELGVDQITQYLQNPD